jgi:hypothetical protein
VPLDLLSRQYGPGLLDLRGLCLTARPGGDSGRLNLDGLSGPCIPDLALATRRN